MNIKEFSSTELDILKRKAKIRIEKLKLDVSHLNLEELRSLSEQIDEEVLIRKADANNDPILIAASDYFDIQIKELRSKKRVREITDPRKIIVKEMRNAGYTYKKIGAIMNIHHASVMYSKNQYDILIEQGCSEFLSNAIAFKNKLNEQA